MWTLGSRSAGWQVLGALGDLLVEMRPEEPEHGEGPGGTFQRRGRLQRCSHRAHSPWAPVCSEPSWLVRSFALAQGQLWFREVELRTRFP